MTSHRQPPSAFRPLSPLTTSTTSKDTMTTPSTQTDPTSYTSRAAQATPAPAASVADLLEAGEPYLLSFGGQATPWRTTLEELLETDREVAADLIALDEEVSRLLAPVATELLTISPRGLRVLDDDGAAVVPAPSHAGQGDEAEPQAVDGGCADGDGLNAAVGRGDDSHEVGVGKLGAHRAVFVEDGLAVGGEAVVVAVEGAVVAAGIHEDADGGILPQLAHSHVAADIDAGSLSAGAGLVYVDVECEAPEDFLIVLVEGVSEVSEGDLSHGAAEVAEEAVAVGHGGEKFLVCKFLCHCFSFLRY